jgi:hypothetical protein
MPLVMDSPPSKPLRIAPYKQQVHYGYIELLLEISISSHSRNLLQFL